MDKQKIVVIGSSNTDMIIRTDRLPAPGETVLGEAFTTAPGGKGANQAVAAARLGCDVAFIARVGNDAVGRQAIEYLSQENIDTRYIIRDDQSASGVALILVGPEGQNMIAVSPGANSQLSPQDIHAARPIIDQASVMLLQLETPLETIFAAAHAGSVAGATVILNPAPAHNVSLSDEILSWVDILTPNETEAAMLTGESSPRAAALSLLESGTKLVLITLGKEGVLLATSPDRLQEFPAFNVKAVDTTAAGDAFNGALAAAIAGEKPLDQIIPFAQAAAALSTTKLGAQPSLPTLREVEAFLG